MKLQPLVQPVLPSRLGCATSAGILCRLCPSLSSPRICSLCSPLRTRSPAYAKCYPIDFDRHILRPLVSNQRLADKFGLERDGKAMTNFGTKDAFRLRDGVEHLHSEDSRAVLIIDDVGQGLVLPVLGLVLGDDAVQILLQHDFLNFAELLEKLLHVVLAEAEAVRNRNPQDSHRLLVMLLQLAQDAVARTALLRQRTLQLFEQLLRSLRRLLRRGCRAVALRVLSSAPRRALSFHSCDYN